MKKQQNLRKKPTYHFENTMVKINQVLVRYLFKYLRKGYDNGRLQELTEHCELLKNLSW